MIYYPWPILNVGFSVIQNACEQMDCAARESLDMLNTELELNLGRAVPKR